MDKEAKEKLGRLYPIYLEAINCRSFIYDRSTGTWFTPQSFKQQYKDKQMSYTQISSLMEVLVIRNPIAGFAAAEKQTMSRINGLVNDIEKELLRQTEFAKFVIRYYLDEEPKNKIL